MTLRLALGAALATAGSLAPVRLPAQDSLPPWQGGITWSLGQPSRVRLHAGSSIGADWRGRRALAPIVHGIFGITRDLGNPVVGALAAGLEGYGGFRGAEVDGGVRGLLHMPILRVSAGADLNLREGQVGLVLGLTSPVRRGGIFGGGSLVRAEWTSEPLGSFRATLVVPLSQPTAGRTRPRADEVDIPLRRGPPPRPATVPDDLAAAIGNMTVAARRINQLLVPALDRPGPDPRVALAELIADLRREPPLPGVAGPYLRPEDVVRAYHAELARAFSGAAGGGATPPIGAASPEGEWLAARAREAILTHVLYPYNRLLGRWRTPTTLPALAAHARGDFARMVVFHEGLLPGREPLVLHVFDELMTTVADIEADARRRWDDSRAVWLPLQLALQPEDHDTQAELDAIIEAGVGAGFTDGNRIDYIINSQFATEVIQTIREAEDYHVLWIHDFRGRNADGFPDANSLRYVVDAYLHALLRRVREYDQRKHLPTYMIFLDQHYYEVNHGRLWLDLLEDPLQARARLPAGFADFAARIDSVQRLLRAAVDSSRLLQAEVRQYGRAWLRNLVKVHVSITNPADPSFWSRQVVPVLGAPDNLMRDHRKIVFYDVTEEDPYRGGAIYTGMGIGEHYAGPTWEDRSVKVQGPAVLPLKAQARRLLESQGLTGDRIPYVLRERAPPPDYGILVTSGIARFRADGVRDQRALELHNLTGFQDKALNVARAILYSLMPPGAVMKAPDSLWGNALLAALLTGSALRGCRVLVVAPSLAAAPSAGWPQMALAHDLLARLIVLQQEFGPDLAHAGGMLKTGIYHPGIGVEDILQRFGAARANARRTPFLRRLFPVDRLVDTLIVRAMADGATAGDSAAMPATPAPVPVMPKLHLKANFFASREGWDSLVVRPEMVEVLQAYLGPFRGQDRDSASAALVRATAALDAAFRATLRPRDRERVMYYLMVGSANEDYRSAYMDGEASVLVAGWAGVTSLVDFGLIMNLSLWIDDLEMLRALVPPPTELERAISRQLRPAL